MRNSLKEDVNRLNITYADNNYIFVPVFLLIAIEIALFFTLGFQIAVLAALPLMTLVILAIIFHQYRKIEDHLEDERRQNQALISLHEFLDLRLPLNSMAGWSAHPELAVTIVEYIELLEPEYIVEAGSGVTSIISCYCLEKNNLGHLLALDHNQEYHSRTNMLLKRHKLSEWGKVAYAPLKSYQLENETWQWYDLQSLDKRQKIDLLIVDGPPVKTQNKARYPAIPLLYTQLSEKAVIILDDAARKPESEVLEAWMRKYPEFSLEFVRSKKGIAILSRNL